MLGFCGAGLWALRVADAATCQVDPSPGYAVLGFWVSMVLEYQVLVEVDLAYVTS